MTYRVNLTVQQGASFAYVYTHKDSAGAAVNLTGYTARMSVRECYGGTLLAYLSTGADAMNGTIALGGVLGTVTLAMTPANTDALAQTWGIYADAMFAAWESGLSGLSAFNGRVSLLPTKNLIYDLELVSGAGVVTRVLEGGMELRRSVTT